MKKLFAIVLVGCFWSCSQYNTGLVSRSWHNLNSKFNALLISKENISVAQEYIAKEYKDNFEEILPIYQIIDSTSMVDTAKLYLVDAIKKSSLIAEKHSNSKYLDDAYLLISEARILKGEFENAIETLKYLNTITKSESVQTEAMSMMMRAYLEMNDFNNADRLNNLLKTKTLTKSNKKNYLTNLAYYHQKKGEHAVVAVFLEETVKGMKKGPEKARYHFILGQMYDRLNQTPIARRNYRLVKKNKPEYDMVFQANLGLQMSESLARNTDLLFEKMLNDRKNQDLKNKIYFKMGETAIKKRDVNGAFKYFNLSVREANDDQIGKAFAYKAIGDIYLDHLIDYENAALYYDSTLITLPQQFVGKSDIGERATYLNEFIRYKKIYDLEDSLQSMAKLSPDVLQFTLEEIVKGKIKAQENKEKEQLEQNAPKASIATNTGKKWRLYDPAVLVKERNDFMSLWGNRQLEDNWRRSEKSSASFFIEEERRTVAVVDSTPAAQAVAVKPSLLEDTKHIDSEVKELKKRIPLTNIQILASKRKQEEAMYRISKIYKLKFRDDKKANESFKKFLNDFPKSVYEPEVLYYLALDEPNHTDNQYAAKLIAQYPNTSFGRQIRKGTITMTQDRETEALQLYQKAFALYEQGNFEQSVNNLEEILNEYVGSQIEDKMAMLRIYALSKFGSKEQYLISLNDFVRAYPSSDLLPKARELLTVVN